MKKGPKRDWAERAAAKIATRYTKHLHETRCNGDCLDVWITRALRRAEKRGYERGKSDGYAEGHKDQMRMRVQDALERNARTRGQYSGNFS